MDRFLETSSREMAKIFLKVFLDGRVSDKIFGRIPEDNLKKCKGEILNIFFNTKKFKELKIIDIVGRTLARSYGVIFESICVDILKAIPEQVFSKLF